MLVYSVHRMHFLNRELKQGHRWFILMHACCAAQFKHVIYWCLAPVRTKSIVHYCTNAQMYCHTFEASQARIVQPSIWIMGSCFHWLFVCSVRCFLHGICFASQFWIQNFDIYMKSKETVHGKTSGAMHCIHSCATFVQSGLLSKGFCRHKCFARGQYLWATVWRFAEHT